jgi:NADPH:quinone reductase-like Zn-dependent oxidoreductase
MKAIVYAQYGQPEVLQFKELDKPTPKNDEVLVNVCAASINSWDWDRLTGIPRLYRLLHGLSRPKLPVLGADIAGKVTAVGDKVTKFRADDEVFGDLCAYKWGGFAEYVCAPEIALVTKPDGMTFEQAASIPQAGVLALLGIRDKGKVRPGQKVLINGAGGGVGTFAIQLAKAFGADVTGVDSREKEEMIRSIGADHFLDYRQHNFTRMQDKYDLILDVVANRSMWEYRSALKPGGIFTMVGGTPGTILQGITLGSLISLVDSRKLGIVTHKPNEGLEYLISLFKEHKLTPVIDRIFPLNELANAFRYFAGGQVKGKLVITI